MRMKSAVFIGVTLLAGVAVTAQALGCRNDRNTRPLHQHPTRHNPWLDVVSQWDMFQFPRLNSLWNKAIFTEPWETLDHVMDGSIFDDFRITFDDSDKDKLGKPAEVQIQEPQETVHENLIHKLKKHLEDVVNNYHKTHQEEPVNAHQEEPVTAYYKTHQVEPEVIHNDMEAEDFSEKAELLRRQQWEEKLQAQLAQEQQRREAWYREKLQRASEEQQQKEKLQKQEQFINAENLRKKQEVLQKREEELRRKIIEREQALRKKQQKDHTMKQQLQKELSFKEQMQREQWLEEKRREEELRKLEDEIRREKKLKEEKLMKMWEERQKEQRRLQKELEEQRHQQELEEQRQKQQEQSLRQQKIEQERRQQQKFEEQICQQQQKLEEQRRQQQILEQQRIQQKLEEQRIQQEKLEEQRRQQNMEHDRLQQQKLEHQRRQQQKQEEQRLQQESLEQQRSQQAKLEEQTFQQQKLDALRIQQQEAANKRQQWQNDRHHIQAMPATLPASQGIKSVVFSMEAPGYFPGDISVKANGGSLHVAGSHMCGCNEDCFIKEFERKVTLPAGIDTESLSATLDSEGHLKVTGLEYNFPVSQHDIIIPVEGLNLPRQMPTAMKYCPEQKPRYHLGKVDPTTGNNHSRNAYKFQRKHSLHEDDDVTIEVADDFS